MTEVQNKNGVTFDIDNIATDLNGKMDKDGLNATCPVIVETYQSGTSWYRIYSDGWCEQGGYVSNDSSPIIFLKPFINTNYSVTLLPQSSSTSSFQARCWYISARATTSVTFAGQSDPAYWEARGYIGESN